MQLLNHQASLSFHLCNVFRELLLESTGRLVLDVNRMSSSLHFVDDRLYEWEMLLEEDETEYEYLGDDDQSEEGIFNQTKSHARFGEGGRSLSWERGSLVRE